MSDPRPWSRRTAAALTVFSLIGALHAVVLAVLAAQDARFAWLAMLAAVYALAASRSARALRRAALASAARSVAVWAASTVAVVGVIGGVFHAGAMFWWTSIAAMVTWLAIGVFVGRRVATESRAAALGGAVPNEALPRADAAGLQGAERVSDREDPLAR